MKKSKLSEHQIVRFLRSRNGGTIRTMIWDGTDYLGEV